MGEKVKNIDELIKKVKEYGGSFICIEKQLIEQLAKSNNKEVDVDVKKNGNYIICKSKDNKFDYYLGNEYEIYIHQINKILNEKDKMIKFFKENNESLQKENKNLIKLSLIVVSTILITFFMTLFVVKKFFCYIEERAINNENIISIYKKLNKLDKKLDLQFNKNKKYFYELKRDIKNIKKVKTNTGCKLNLKCE